MAQTAPPDTTLDTIDPARIEKNLDDQLLGDSIRRLRLKRSMGLVDLGKLTGLSASFLSQLETGRVVPTLRNLARIALVFNKDLSYFFPQKSRVVFRTLPRQARLPIARKQKLDARFVSESLGALIPDRTIVPCLAEFHPNGDICDFIPKVFAGTEFIFVIEGALEIATPADSQLLEASDVCWVDANTPRRYLCTGEGVAKALIVTSHTA